MTDWRARRAVYEARAAGLVSLIDRLRAEGHDWEFVARAAVDARNALKQDARHDDDAEAVDLIERRNRARYGNALGPTADALFARYGTWEEVARAACRTQRLSDKSRRTISSLLRRRR